jgi:hypothetical protein
MRGTAAAAWQITKRLAALYVELSAELCVELRVELPV